MCVCLFVAYTQQTRCQVDYHQVLYCFAKCSIFWEKLCDEFVEALIGIGASWAEQLFWLVFFQKLFM
jgi:hypothetical protein